MQVQNHHRQDLSSLLPKRVKGSYSESFRKVDIVSNHFKVTFGNNIDQLNIYSIRFDPGIPRDNRRKREQILSSIWTDVKEFIQNPVICGMNICSITDSKEEIKQFQSQQYKITIKKVKTLDLRENKSSLLFFLNNLYRNVMAQRGYAEIGRTGKYFNIKYKKEIDNLNMYSGFKANFCNLQLGIFLRVQSAKKIVRNQSVLDFINDLYKKNQSKDKDQKRNIVRQALQNQIVQVNYGNGRYYKIQDILYKELTEVMIQGEKINILEYYKQKYGITVTKTKQPLLKIQNKKGKFQILLLPQLCLMTGIPDDFDQFKRKKVSEHTILDPITKRKQIMSVMDQIEKSGDFDNLGKIGIQLSRKMLSLEAKSIPVPRLALGENQKVQQGREAFFNLFGQPIYASKHKVKLAILYFKADLRDLIRTFEQTSQKLKVEFSYDKFQIRDERRAIEEMDKILQRANEKGFNIALIVIPPYMKTQYKKFKQVCLIRNKMVCQIACQANLRKKNAQSIATKILLQIIAKRGNTLWVPQIKAKTQNLMLVGVDTASISGNKSLLAACGTVNSTFTSIYSKHLEFQGLQGKYSVMAQAVLDILNYYVDRNKNQPKDIIVFMNSCSMEQVKILKEYFIDVFLKKCEEIYRQKAPAIQVVMINTKTSERFFLPNGENVRAGTLINSEVVSKQYDFYLVSQNSNKGCVVPNHYKVVFTNSKMEEGVLQELVFGQCFNYINWSGSIKIPGILQYAKKCAKFNSEVMTEQQISQSLQRCLYFV